MTTRSLSALLITAGLIAFWGCTTDGSVEPPSIPGRTGSTAVPAKPPVKPRQPLAKAKVFTCSMHPAVRRSTSGKCPICGMDIIPATPSPMRPPQLAKLVRWTCGRPGSCVPVKASVEAAFSARVLKASLAKLARRKPSGPIAQLAIGGMALQGDATARRRLATLWSENTFHAHWKLWPKQTRRKLRQLLGSRRATTSASPGRSDARRAAMSTAANVLLRAGDPAGRAALYRFLSTRPQPRWVVSTLDDLSRYPKRSDRLTARQWLANPKPEVRVTAAKLWLLAGGVKVK